MRCLDLPPKKWSKGKMREKKVHRCVFTKGLYDTVMKDAPKKLRVITVYHLIEEYKINGSLARRVTREMLKKGTIKPVATSSAMSIYTASDAFRAQMEKDKATKAAANEKKASKKKKGKK